MKLSISWIFDHIGVDWKKQNIGDLVSKFNLVSAEIEHFYKVEFDLTRFALCKVIKEDSSSFTVSIPEWKKEVVLPKRDDSKSSISISTKDLVFMVCANKGKDISWAKLKDFDMDKDGLIPPLDVSEKDLSGGWKNYFEAQDYILEVDNKSITHRPDMWCHRGFAREIAAMLDLNLIPTEKFLVKKEVFTFDKLAKGTKTNPISIEIKAEKECKRFAGMYLSSMQNRPTNPLILSRFLKVGVRPMNGFVDLTNYLMLDWSQPVHAYDAQKIEGEKIVARMAKSKEKLTLLDGAQIELTDQDLVIADDKKALCLAGIMGGLNSGVGVNTKSIFLEAAIFDAASVRRTSLRFAYRTESSMRFEKTLDPNQNIEGIFRFLKLAKDFGITFDSSTEVLSVGPVAEELTLQIKHDFFEKRSGLELSEYDISIPLERLGFKLVKNLVEDSATGKRDLIYSITVPTFRGSKDIEIQEDILEEIIRFYGFDKVKLQLPKLEKKPFNLNPVFRVRKIKNFLANSAKMFEQQNYILLDEKFLMEVGLTSLQAAGEIVNPVSQDAKRLLPSLLPGLFKNIKENFHEQDSLKFFEVGRVWSSGKESEIVEHKKVSGIFFEKRKAVDFYECKNHITELLEYLGIDFDKIEWQKIDEPTDMWCAKYQSANIIFDKKNIGILGKIDCAFLSKLDVLPESDAFFFELDLNFLIGFDLGIKKFKPLPKFQETSFDLSLLVPLKIETMSLKNILCKIDDLVTKVELIDFFEKEEWVDKKSLTFRVWLNNPDKTLEKEEIDSVREKTIKSMQKSGAELRI
jgi:phenylalanyl-tRNA synthetase beta chain